MDDADTMTTYGIEVRRGRKALGWTQARLAAEILVSERTVLRIEGGERPSPDTAAAVLSVLGVPAPAEASAMPPLVPPPADEVHARLLATLIEEALRHGAQIMLASDIRAFEAVPGPVPPRRAAGIRDRARRREALLASVYLVHGAIVTAGVGLTILSVYGLTVFGLDPAHTGTSFVYSLPSGFALLPAVLGLIANRDLARIFPGHRAATQLLVAMEESDAMRQSLHGVSRTELLRYVLRDGAVTTSRFSLKAVSDVVVSRAAGRATISLAFEGASPVTIRDVPEGAILDEALALIASARSDLPYRIAA